MQLISVVDIGNSFSINVDCTNFAVKIGHVLDSTFNSINNGGVNIFFDFRLSRLFFGLGNITFRFIRLSCVYTIVISNRKFAKICIYNIEASFSNCLFKLAVLILRNCAY